jgi:hypothetical protein
MALVSAVLIVFSSFLGGGAWDMGFAGTPVLLGEAGLLALHCGVPEGGDDDELAGALLPGSRVDDGGDQAGANVVDVPGGVDVVRDFLRP